jgi:DNA-binding MarR family transcriptional regulator
VPLVYAQGRYAVATEHPELKGHQDRTELQFLEGPAQDSLSTLLFRAYHFSSAGFEIHRQAEGVDFVQSAVLFVLSEAQSLTTTDIVERAYLPTSVIADTLAELSEKKLVVRNLDESFTLTDLGRQRREAIHAKVGRYYGERLAEIPDLDIEHLKKTLSQIIKYMSPSAL